MFDSNGCELKNDGQNPTIVTVVNASQLQLDVDRDMAAAKLTSISFKYIYHYNQLENIYRR